MYQGIVTGWTCTNVFASTTQPTLETSSTCLSTAASSTILGASSSLPIYTQDSGNIVLGLAIIITLIFIAFTAFMFNAIKRKTPWR